MANIQGDGAAEDMIRAIVQIGCAEVHMKTLLEKFDAELANGIIDVDDAEIVQKQVEKIEEVTEEINNLAELRRGVMLRLFDMYEGDKNYWCLIKHLGIASYTLFEAYQATNDTELLNLYIESNKRFIKALTRFLGKEITECAACFSDMMKGEKHGD